MPPALLIPVEGTGCLPTDGLARLFFYFFSFMTLATSSRAAIAAYGSKRAAGRAITIWRVDKADSIGDASIFPSTHPIPFLVRRLLWPRSNKGKKRQIAPPRHVKHTATAWPNYPTQFFPFHHGVNVYGQRKRFCRFPFLRHLMTPSEKKNPKLVAQAVLDRYIFFLPFTPPRSTALNFSTHCSIGPRPIFFLRYLVTQSRNPRHTAQSVLDRFFIFHATSWHRAEVLDTLLKRSTLTMWPDKQNQTPLSASTRP